MILNKIDSLNIEQKKQMRLIEELWMPNIVFLSLQDHCSYDPFVT